ncbi:MAG TPA: cytochrome P450 [Solirubrobacteraceae bacterium]|nr:cytochrome P450 [Solirubrobacteraceae bacterium]
MTVETSTEHERAGRLVASLFDGTVADPYPIYETLRESGDGIHWADAPHAYVVCRYEDVRTTLSDPSRFSSDVFWDSPQSIHDSGNADQRRFVEVNSHLFMFADPPIHTRIRSSFKRAFTPPAMARWRPIAEDVTAKLMKDNQPGDEIEVMSTLASRVPVAVIAHILGVPEEMHERFREWSYAYASSFDPMVQGERRDEVIRTSLELMDYLAELITERRSNPTEDLISVLLSTETSTGDHLSDLELVATLTLLLVAGNETTTHVIGSGIALLIQHPEAKQALMREPELIESAIEEILRYEPPIQLLIRKTAGDIRLGDHDLPAGTMLMPCTAAANRDPRRFDRPLEFDIRRANNRHVAFAHGIHFCVGAALARLELAVVFEQILNHYPDIRLGSTPPVRRSANSTVRGYENLTVCL